MPERLREPEYPATFVVRRANEAGRIQFLGVRLKLAALLAKQPIGLHQIDDDEWEVWYGPLLVGYVLVRDGKPVIEAVA